MTAADGHVPRTAIPRLAKRIGRDVRVVRYWFDENRSPRDAERIVPLIADALDVDLEWLTDGKDTPPVRRSKGATNTDIPEELLRLLPPKYRRLAFALFDPVRADWLSSQLDLFERAHAQGRGSR